MTGQNMSECMLVARAHPDLNQGPADLQSAALTTELCTQVMGMVASERNHTNEGRWVGEWVGWGRVCVGGGGQGLRPASFVHVFICVWMFDNLRADEFKCAFAHGLEEVYVQS